LTWKNLKMKFQMNFPNNILDHLDLDLDLDLGGDLDLP